MKKINSILVVAFLVISVFTVFLTPINADIESNDSFSDAEEIDVPGEFTGELNSTNEQDYYKFELDASQIIEIEFISQAGNAVELTLYDYDREERLSVRSSEGSLDSDDLSLANETISDFWFIGIEGATAGGWDGNYTFTINISHQDDSGSGGDVSSSWDHAYEISEGEHQGQIRDLDDKDMYKIELGPGQIIDIEFSSQANNDVDLTLYDPEREEILTVRSSEGMPDSDDFSLANGTSTDLWFIGIEGATAGGWDGDYTFTVSIDRQDDAGIGGDAVGADSGPSLPENPTPINSGLYEGYMNEPGDIRDIYGIDLSSGYTITVSVNPSSSIAVDTWLYNDEYNELASDNGNPLGEKSEVTYTATSDEFIYIWLKCQDGDGTYDMDIDVRGTVEGTIMVDGAGEVIVETYNEELEKWEEHANSPVEGQLTDEISVGTLVRLTAVPNQGWEFSKWTGDETGTDNPIQFTMDEDKSVTADFEEVTTLTYTLTVNTDGKGSIDIDPDQTEYENGETVKLTAIPDQGWEFSEWTGDATGTSDEITITMDEDKTITADFEEKATDNGDYPDFIQKYIEKGMWCFALLIIIPILIIIVIIVVLVKLLRSGDSGGKRPPQQQQRQQPPQQEQPSQEPGDSEDNLPPPPPEDN